MTVEKIGLSKVCICAFMVKANIDCAPVHTMLYRAACVECLFSELKDGNAPNEDAKLQNEAFSNIVTRGQLPLQPKWLSIVLNKRQLSHFHINKGLTRSY